jgi:hypothetical protein
LNSCRFWFSPGVGKAFANLDQRNSRSAVFDRPLCVSGAWKLRRIGSRLRKFVLLNAGFSPVCSLRLGCGLGGALANSVFAISHAKFA